MRQEKLCVRTANSEMDNIFITFARCVVVFAYMQY